MDDTFRNLGITFAVYGADEGIEVGQNVASRADEEQRALDEGLRNLLAERDRMMNLLKDALESHERAVGAARTASDRLRAALAPDRP